MLNITAPDPGDLVQLNFDAFSLGVFEPYCPHAYMQITETTMSLNEGGRWCGSAWGYAVYYSETPQLNIVLRLDKRKPHHQQDGGSFEFRMSYKFLHSSDATLRYGDKQQKSLRPHRGTLVDQTYCDRVLYDCSMKLCRIQSPNYPGILPRNVTCRYIIKERTKRRNKQPLITVRSVKEQQSDRQTSLQNDHCGPVKDLISISDGHLIEGTILSNYCITQPIPEIFSSGSELLVTFQSASFGLPVLPQPLSNVPGFDLEVGVVWVPRMRASIERRHRCRYTIDSSRTSGVISNPIPSLPPNTTCEYRFVGKADEIIWLAFSKYHVTLPSSVEACAVELSITDTRDRFDDTEYLIEKYCNDDIPILCAHSLLANLTRTPRPCSQDETYLSQRSQMIVRFHTSLGTVHYPVSYSFTYEFIDLAQGGEPCKCTSDDNSSRPLRSYCDRIFQNTTTGRINSPRIAFLYGRGGRSQIHCRYELYPPSNDKNRLTITFKTLRFAATGCNTGYNVHNDSTFRWMCDTFKPRAFVRISEYPWQQRKDISLLRDCFCSNITKPTSVTVVAGYKTVVEFYASGMGINDDFNTYHFEASFTYDRSNCYDVQAPFSNYGGHLNFYKSVQKLNHRCTDSTKRILALVEPEESLTSFVYLNIRGVRLSGMEENCLSNSRIVVHPEAGSADEFHVICPQKKNASVQFFSSGWYRENPPSFGLAEKHARSFVLEILNKQQPSNNKKTKISNEYLDEVQLNWMQVRRNPGSASNILAAFFQRPPSCAHSCPELDACINPRLWCDGIADCPSGWDEAGDACAHINYLNEVLLYYILLIGCVLVGLFLVFMLVWQSYHISPRRRSTTSTMSSSDNSPCICQR